MALTGSLSEVEAPDVVQLISLSRKTGVLSITDEFERCRLYFRQGELVHATSGVLSGNEAAFHVLAKKQGDFAFEPAPVDCPTTVTLEGESLILEGMRRLDHWERLRTELPVPDSIVRRVPGIQAKLTAHESQVLPLADGARTIETVAQESGLPEMEAYETLLSLLRKGVVQAVAAQAPPSAEPAFEAGVETADARRPLTASDLESIIRRVAAL